MAICPVDSVIQPLDNWGLVFQKMDNAIHPIIHYLADSVLCFVDTNPLDSVIHTLNNWQDGEVYSVLPSNTQPGLQPGPHNSESTALNIRSQHIQQYICTHGTIVKKKMKNI